MIKRTVQNRRADAPPRFTERDQGSQLVHDIEEAEALGMTKAANELKAELARACPDHKTAAVSRVAREPAHPLAQKAYVALEIAQEAVFAALDSFNDLGIDVNDKSVLQKTLRTMQIASKLLVNQARVSWRDREATTKTAGTRMATAGNALEDLTALIRRTQKSLDVDPARGGDSIVADAMHAAYRLGYHAGTNDILTSWERRDREQPRGAEVTHIASARKVAEALTDQDLEKMFATVDIMRALHRGNVATEIEKAIEAVDQQKTAGTKQAFIPESMVPDYGEVWLPDDLSYDTNRKVAEVSSTIRWDIGQAFGFVVALLEDVNAHQEAAAVNKLLLASYTPQNPLQSHDATAAVRRAISNKISDSIDCDDIMGGTITNDGGFCSALNKKPSKAQYVEKAAALQRRLSTGIANKISDPIDCDDIMGGDVQDDGDLCRDLKQKPRAKRFQIDRDK